MTKRIATAAVVCGALVVPAVASADDQPSPENFKNAAKYCKAVRKAAGEQNFRTMFGGKKNAYGKCVSKAARRDEAQEQEAKTDAAQQCKAEQSQTDDQFKAGHDGKTFAQFYGTNDNGKNAYGKCVSQHAKANKTEADQDEKQDASSAKACRTEQAQSDDDFKSSHGGKTFTQFYGTNDNGKNAFGKCVSSKSKEANEQDDQQEQQGSTTSGS